MPFMKICPKTILIALLYWIPVFVFSQSPKVLIEKKPLWINSVSFEVDAHPPAGQESGYYYLLIDEQENRTLEDRYLHYAYKILTNEGIQEMSDLRVQYDPSYEQLILHQVTVHRDNEVIDQLSNHIQTIQREQSMDRYLYDGSLTAVINLTDIRVGDIIEYAFTRKGYNPVYNGHLSKKIYFNFNLPYEKLYQRLIVPSALSLDLEYRNSDIKPEIFNRDNKKEYIWSLKNANALILDSNVPDWYDGNQFVMITDFKNWGEVAAWATKHFNFSVKNQPELKKRADAKFKDQNDESYALEAIRFVQDDIRYLGFESGLNSHQPHPPVKVFDQRFGDCKDKSLLLCELLKLKGLEAFPVLVNTVWRNKLTNESPSIQAFNHCVVQLKVDGRTYYVDPTINNQGGDLESNYFPSYGKGLVVSETSRDLIDLPSPVASEISEVQTFEVSSLEGEAILNVRTTYTGSEADHIRSEFLKNSLESVQKNYLTFYGNLYPDIEIHEPIATKDDRSGNMFSVEENYRIPTFWQQSETAEELMFCDVYPQSLENYFSVSKSSQRAAPYRLNYPVSYHHSIHIRLPEEWTVEPEDEIIESDFYAYEHIVKYANNEITLQTHYETRQDHIPVQAFDKFVSDHEKMMENLLFQLTYNKNVVFNEKGISWLGIITALVAFSFGIWIVLRLYYYFDPEPAAPAPSGGQPIGGWLILISIGLCITPFRLVYDLFNMPEVYDSMTWANLLGLKRYGLFGFFLLEHVYNMIFLPFCVLVLVLFFKRRTSLPRIITIYLAVGCVVTTADTLVSVQIDPTLAEQGNYYKDMIRSILSAAIWIPYFNMSTRVKETFVKRVNDDEDDSPYAAEVAGDQYQTTTLDRS